MTVGGSQYARAMAEIASVPLINLNLNVVK